MKYRFLIVILLLVCFLAASGCQGAIVTTAAQNTSSSIAVSSAASAVSGPAVSTTSAETAGGTMLTQFPFTFTDDAGRSVTLTSAAERIVSLSPSNTEMVFALGLGHQLVGNTSYCNYPEPAQDITRVGGFSDVDIEKVVSVQPDVILASDLHKETMLPSLENLGIPVVIVHPITLEGVYQDLNLLGRISGRDQAAADLSADLKAREEMIRARTAGMSGEKPRVLYVTWHDPVYTAGDNTLTGELIKIAGGANIASDVNDYDIISLEQVVERNPQIIVVMSSMGSNTSVEYINGESRLQSTDALINQRVYVVDSDIFGRTTPRIVDALEQLANLIHPD